jgi:hypothetical protein
MTVKRSQLLRFMAVVLALAFPVLLAACGGDDETTTAADTPDQTQTDASSGGDDGGDGSSGSDSEQTLTDPRGDKPPRPIEREEPPKVPKGGDDSIQTFGEQADDKQAAEIAEVARGFFKAQANQRWKDACFYLSSSVTDFFAEAASQAPAEESIPSDCPSLLKQLGQGVPKSARKSIAKVRVKDVRLDGDEGFVLYIGARRKWYAIAVGKEDTGWKVRAMSGAPIYSG